MSITNDIRNTFRYSDTIIQLILVNVLAFVVQTILLVIFFLAGQREVFLDFLGKWMYVHSDWHHLLTRPWTLITYQYLHDPLGILHILFNMLYLFFFGRVFVQFSAHKNALPLYVTGGIIGALVFAIACHIIPSLKDLTGQNMVGASAAVMAIVIASATLAPNHTFFLMFIGPVKLKYIALVVILIDLVSMPREINVGGHLAHLAGAATGFAYVQSYRRGRNWFRWWDTFSLRLQNMFRRRRPRIVYVQQDAAQSKRKEKDKQQEKLDAILDKIKASGYDSLSKSEKDFLFKVSNDKE
ncbi:MAG: rhomboid family intramembrane serine protease [Chitinophagales bacterium]